MAKVEDSILHSIKKNGFPDKAVNLPFRPIFNACKKQGEKLADVLKTLESQEVYSEIGEEKILFYREKPQPAKQEKQTGNSANNPFGFDAGDLFNGIPEDMINSAMEKMGNMDPEQLAKMKETLSQVDPEQLASMKEAVSKMSPEERENLMNQAKNMFNKE